nr:YchJ family metal-binding protein [Echinimonas agarilytica]
MRARYTAHTQNNISFIFNSWHPSTRPESSEPVEEWNSQCSWLALNVAQSRKVGTKGFVEFVALYRQAGQLKQHHEEANFRFEKGQWWYMNQST